MRHLTRSYVAEPGEAPTRRPGIGSCSVLGNLGHRSPVVLTRLVRIQPVPVVFPCSRYRIVRKAVSVAINLGDLETAVEWAEQGRSIVWQNMLGLRTPVDDPRLVHPQLADGIQRIARQMGQPLLIMLPT
jgi:hypothetical protein